MMTQGVSRYTMTTDRLRLSSGRSSFVLYDDVAHQQDDEQLDDLPHQDQG